MSFRSALLALVLGLILVSTLATTYFGLGGMRKLIRALLDKQIATTLDAVTSLVEEHFEPAERLLSTIADDISDGRVPTANPEELGRILADDLRYEEGVSWLGFGYPDGRFAAARTENGDYYVNVSEPGGGPPKEWLVDGRGGLLPHVHPGLPAAYDARERPWFTAAEKADGQPVWTPPYDFAHGGRGITAARAIRDEAGRPGGVLMIDFLFKDVAAYIDRLANDFRGEPLVFSLNGSLLASPSALSEPSILEAIREQMRETPLPPRSRQESRVVVIEVPHGDDTYFVGLRRIVVTGGLECVGAILFRKSEVFQAVDASVKFSIGTAAAALLVSLAAGFLLSARIASPLGEISREVAKLGNFELGGRPLPHSTIREVRVLSDSVGRMRTGLQSFARYVPVDLVRELVRGGGVAALGGERRMVAVLFSDLAGFTSYAEKTEPEEASELLTMFFESFGEAVDANGGVIDKFLGDGLMALFNAPERIPSPEAAACRAALAALRAWEPEARARKLDVRVGLHCGEVLVGNVGTRSRFSYTAIGDAVNLSSRLENLNKLYGTRILASATFRKLAGESEFVWRALDRVGVAGRGEPLEICTLAGLRADAGEADLRMAADSDRAVAAFFDGDFDLAGRLLAAIGDAAAGVLAGRIPAARAARVSDPSWSPVLRLEKQ